MYTAVATYENGEKDAAEFLDYAEMVAWFALRHPAAGVAAYEESCHVDQLTLCNDILAYNGNAS